MPEGPVTVTVQIDGVDIPTGRLWAHRRAKTESASFAYHPEYLALNGAYPLDPTLLLSEGQHQTAEGQKIFGALSDCAPDGWGRRLIQREQRKQALAGSPHRELGEIDYLLGVRDDLRQGNLRFRIPGDDNYVATDTDSVPHLIGLPRLLNAAAALEQENDSDEDLRILLRGGSSLGGARPKAHVLDPNGHLSIAKFPAPKTDEWDVIRWEAVALTLARDAAINTPAFFLQQIDGKPILIIRRFDRQQTLRVAYLSAMSMLEQTDGQGGDYIDIAESIEESSPNATQHLHEMWRRIIFTILISNTDDHLRNHGFLRHSTAGWTISPIFDVNPNPEPGVKHFSTSVDGDDTGSLQRALDAAEIFRTSQSEAQDIVGQVAVATSAWRAVAARVGLAKAACDQMAPAFEHDCADHARRLAASRRR